MRTMKKVVISFVILATITLSLAPLTKVADDNHQPPTISPFDILDYQARCN